MDTIAAARQSAVVSTLGRKDGEPLVVDIRGTTIHDWSELWDALSEPCGLPSWFGRNLDAWWDTIQTGAISDVIDDHPLLIVRLVADGLFAPGAQGDGFIKTTNDCDFARVEMEST